MKIGAAIFFTDYSITPTELAVALEERGFNPLWVAEHSMRVFSTSPCTMERLGVCQIPDCQTDDGEKDRTGDDRGRIEPLGPLGSGNIGFFNRASEAGQPANRVWLFRSPQPAQRSEGRPPRRSALGSQPHMPPRPE
jgi:hypothetical protein